MNYIPMILENINTWIINNNTWMNFLTKYMNQYANKLMLWKNYLEECYNLN